MYGDGRRWTISGLGFGVLLGLSFSALVLPRAWALSDAEIEGQVEDVLAQRHPKDGAAFWKGLGPQGPRVIRGMILKAESTYHRVRLIEALGYFEDKASEEEIRRFAQSTESQALRIAAVRAAGRNPALLDVVTGVLTDADPQLRLAAGRTLKANPSAAARTQLETYLAQEKVPWVVAGVKGGAALAEVTRTAQLAPSGIQNGMEPKSSPCQGEWEGILLHPKAGKGGVHTLPVRLTVEGGATLVVRHQILLPIPSRFAVSGTLARASCVGGVIKFAAPAVWGEALQVFDRSVPGTPASKPLPQDWILLSTQESGETWWESRGPGGSRLILRKTNP